VMDATLNVVLCLRGRLAQNEIEESLVEDTQEVRLLLYAASLIRRMYRPNSLNLQL